MEGLAFIINKDKKDQSVIGYERILIKQRVLSRVDRIKQDENTESESYHYRLCCIVQFNKEISFDEMDEDDLVEEIMGGIYVIDKNTLSN